MKSKALKLLQKFIFWLQKQYNKFEKKATEFLPYNSLSPIGNADIGNDYEKALDWALNNRVEKDIKNIALTGPYGSGKSSILKTYEAKCKGTDLKFLKISLATFKEEETEKDEDVQKDKNADEKKGTASKDELLRLIEISILQQIFYHEEDKKIPDSRFKKIKSYNNRNLWLTAIAIFLLITSITNLIYPKFLADLFLTNFSSKVLTVFHFISLIITATTLLIIIRKSIRTLNGITINKLNIQSAEIGFGESKNKSILNHHLDEILYFFEVTPYNVVIIEDLDRFKQTEIFTKLREINLLLHNSKKTEKKHVVFIYAVRDDIFQEENERTKFFDFIIPVIPVINPSNSSQKLLEKQNLHNYNISEDLIDSIALFIDDMRLLYNILNEFYLYYKKVSNSLEITTSLNQDKLLAIIVYKNLFPTDFTLLSNNEGVLFNSINNKHKYTDSEISRLEDETRNLKREIKGFESLRIKDIKELRYLYVLFYIPNLSGFSSFYVDNSQVSAVDMVSEKNFERLINGSVKYYGTYMGMQSISVSFSQIEKQVDNERTYLERLKQIEDWNNEEVEALKYRIDQLETNKSQVINLKVRELLSRGNININIANEKQKSLVNVLLRNGFIDEDYLDYVSLFYEGTITKTDYQFLMNVKSQIQTSFDYKLIKVDKLINKINTVEFDKDYILNYSLLDFILTNQKYNSYKKIIFRKLADESTTSVKFIDGFIDTNSNIKRFISELTAAWNNIWEYLDKSSYYTKEKKDRYFKLIIENAEIEDIEGLYHSSFKRNLLEKKDFLSIIPNVGRLKAIIKALEVIFTELDVNRIPDELFDYIYEGNYYEINPSMIRLLMQAQDDFKQSDFDTKNYSLIEKSNAGKLKSYISYNIAKYVQNVFLRIDTNTQEDEEYLVALLNNEALDTEIKQKIIDHIQIVIGDLGKVKDLAVAGSLLINNKAAADWKNLLDYYKRREKDVDEAVVTFIDYEEVATKLSLSKVEKVVNDESECLPFILKLIGLNDLNDTSYSLILKSFPIDIEGIDYNEVSANKATLLIENYIPSFNPTSYDKIKESFKNVHILFLEKNKANFLINISEYDLEAADIYKLLQSTAFSNDEKNKIIEANGEDLIIAQSDVVKSIGELILKSNSFRVSDSLLKSILLNKELTVEQKIRIHNWKHIQVANEFYDTFLTSLNKDHYSDITIKNKRPLIVNNEYNRKLIDILDSKNYISKFDYEDKGIRVITFRKPNEQV